MLHADKLQQIHGIVCPEAELKDGDWTAPANPSLPPLEADEWDEGQ